MLMADKNGASDKPLIFFKVNYLEGQGIF